MTLEESLVALRAWRDEFAESHGYDLEAMGAALEKMNLAAGRTVVRGEPRPPSPPTATKRGPDTPAPDYCGSSPSVNSSSR